MRFEYFIQRFVQSFVMLNAQQEIVEHCFVFNILVVGTVDFNFFYGRLYNLGVITDRFDKKQLVAHFFHYDGMDHPASVTCRVGRVKNLHASQTFDLVTPLKVGCQKCRVLTYCHFATTASQPTGKLFTCLHTFFKKNQV